MPTWALATHPHQGEERAAHLGAVEGKGEDVPQALPCGPLDSSAKGPLGRPPLLTPKSLFPHPPSREVPTPFPSL